MKKRSLGNRILVIAAALMVFLAPLLPIAGYAMVSDTLNITVNVDGTPPVTSHDYDGAWHKVDFTITLTAADSQSGVKETYYKINGGDTAALSIEGQPVISAQGDNNTLEYWSADNFNNEEVHETLTGIKLDKTAPTVTISSPTEEEAFSASPITVSGTVNDGLSGIDELKIEVGALQYIPLINPDSTYAVNNVDIVGGPNAIKAIAEDRAGNSAQFNVTAFLGWVLHLQIPYSAVGTYYSGAACTSMILNYIRDGVVAGTLAQDTIYNYGHPYNYSVNSSLDEMDAKAIDYSLGHFDPYDQNDPVGQGDPYKAYNFGVQAFASDKFTEYLRDVIHWMAFPVTIDPWWKHGPLVNHPNTPAAAPAYGAYAHWIVVNGASTDGNPAPDPHVNPWYTPDFTVYGLWLTDPASGGIGQDLYVTAQTARDTYLLALQSQDQHNGKFLQVAEPPEEESDAQVEIAPPAITAESAKIIEIADGLSARPASHSSSLLEERIENTKRHIYDAALAVNLEDDRKSTDASPTMEDDKDKLLLSVFGPKTQEPLELDWARIVDPSLLTDENFRKAFDGSQARSFVKVRRPDKVNSFYYLIPFDKYINGQFLTYAAIIVDAENGAFQEASWVKEPFRFIQVTQEEAIRKVIEADSSTKEPALTSELVWEPGDISQSPFYPYYRVSSESAVYYVTQKGEVITE